MRPVGIPLPWRVQRAKVILALGGLSSSIDVSAIVCKSLHNLIIWGCLTWLIQKHNVPWMPFHVRDLCRLWCRLVAVGHVDTNVSVIQIHSNLGRASAN